MLEWSDEYCTGIAKVDDQHKKLFQMVNEFEKDIREGKGERAYRAALVFLSGYVKNHFGFEEKCMEEHRCPMAETNHNAHQKFLATFKSFEEKLGKEGFTWENLRDLHTTVEDWLVSHICKVDVHLKSCVVAVVSGEGTRQKSISA
jgi:hemerythrin